ncbi:hypothetical protein [Modestobacter roseus]|uniref:hypothetical protein n=1 Tax=Modestobacter roseus TaxID=1181884 RepID=UPI001296EEB5|nr:hypothetical protein [Modestobacter roseus]MQA35256.1 hypothetical protein [Modestobacter roseus]
MPREREVDEGADRRFRVIAYAVVASAFIGVAVVMVIRTAVAGGGVAIGAPLLLVPGVVFAGLAGHWWSKPPFEDDR